jgi:hypothetical protein
MVLRKVRRGHRDGELVNAGEKRRGNVTWYFLRNSEFPKVLGKRLVGRAIGKPRPLFSKPGTDPRCEDKRPNAGGKSKHLVS